MYGQSSQEVSQKVLELRQRSEISKVHSMFEDHRISAHYGKFQEVALQLLAQEKAGDEEAERLKVEELEKKYNLNQNDKQKKGRKK